MTADIDYPQAVLAWLETGGAPLLCHRSVQLWNAVYAELSPIVGVSGFAALFSRCIDLCGASHPWLTRAPARSAPALCFDTLGAQLAKCAAPEALVASGALLLSFHGLLAQLIGAALADGVLEAAWRDRLARQPAQPTTKDCL